MTAPITSPPTTISRLRAELAAPEHEPAEHQRRYERQPEANRRPGAGRHASAGRSDVGALISHRNVSSPLARQGANTPFSVMYADDGEEHQHDPRFQVAGTRTDQRLAAAAGRERHAEAEQEAADEVRQPRHAAPSCRSSWPISIDPAACSSAVPAIATAIASSHIRMRRQSPNVHDVGDRSHRAEADAVGDGAEDERERERKAGDERRVGKSGAWHREIISWLIRLSRQGAPLPGLLRTQIAWMPR